MSGPPSSPRATTASRSAAGVALHALAAIALFAVAFAVRWRLRQGLVLGDDPQEFAVLLHILVAGPLLTDQLHLRFGGWIFNHLFFWLFGVSETTFLLPTMLLTSAFAVMAYAILLRWGYGRLRAFLGGLLVGLAPFELVLGSLRANDSYIELALAVGFTALVLLEERPTWQGVVLALCTWFGFYVKLWAVYVLPALGLYWLLGRRWRSAIAYVVASVVVHGATCAYWYAKLGTPLPFISVHAANYAVPLAGLPELFLKYPRLIFVGSFEFPTTLWGAVPYVLVAVLLLKIGGTLLGRGPAALRLDRADALVGTCWASFFLLLEFFPNGFELDAYYSVPRIFRYLAPISFPIALHAAKCALDLTRVRIPGVPPRFVATVAGLALASLYVAQAVEANGPSAVYRENFQAVLRDVEAMSPPAVVAESVVASYFRDLYLAADEREIHVVVLTDQHAATDYERWLRDHEAELPTGTLLVTGLGSFVHYGAHIDGFRLAWFQEPLSPSWTLVREYGTLDYLPKPEPARLWRLDRPAGAAGTERPSPREDLSPLAGMDDPAELFRGGMARYDANDYAGARVYFRKLLATPSPQRDDAYFFYAASFFRQGEWARARREFKRLLRHSAGARWIPAAYWHVATCERSLGHLRRARRLFAEIVRRFPGDRGTVTMARRDLETFRRRRGGVLVDWWRRL